MYSNMTAAEVYRREAERLQSMADAMTYGHVRDGFLEMARRYDVMAEQAENITSHKFGRPFSRRSGGPAPQHS
jgi:hypothetical protein